MANKANKASLAEPPNKSLADGSIAVVVKYLGKLLTLLPFFLTKYSAIFAEVKGYFRISGVFGLDNQLGGANKVVGVTNTANEHNKLDGADVANVIVKVKKIVVVDKAIWFCCMFSLRMQDHFRINNVAEGQAEGRVVDKSQAKGHAVAKGWAEGQVVAKGRAKGHVVAKGRAKGHVVAESRAEGHVAAGVPEGGRVAARFLKEGHVLAGVPEGGHVAARVPEGGHVVAGVLEGGHVAAGAPEGGHVAPDNQHG